jgi:MOSC domain-containing protein YiiM
MAKRFLASRRTGFYLRVLREGEIGAGDEIVRVHRDENRVSIADAMKVYLGDPDAAELRARPARAISLQFLARGIQRAGLISTPRNPRMIEFQRSPWDSL